MPYPSTARQSFKNESEEPAPDSWKRFFVVLTGKTNGAHESVVKHFKSLNQTETTSPGDADYCLVVCPVVSRVGTDVREAMDHLLPDKEAVLVVMHQTFNPEQVIPPSSRLVEDQRVRLTLDCLFHQGKLLQCELNKNMNNNIKRFLRDSAVQDQCPNRSVPRFLKSRAEATSSNAKNQYVVFRDKKQVRVREQDMTADNLSCIFQVSPRNLFVMDDGKMVLFPGASGVFTSSDLNPGTRYEVHGEDKATPGPADSTGWTVRFGLPGTRITSSPPQETISASTPTFQSPENGGAASVGDMAVKIDEFVRAANSLTDATAAVRQLTDLVTTPKVILTQSQLLVIKQGLSCFICLKFIDRPVFAECCQSIIGCRACVERWQQNSASCPKCQRHTDNDHMSDIKGVSEVFSVLKSVFEDE